LNKSKIMKQLYTLILMLVSFCVTAQMNMLTDGDFEANNAASVWTGNVEIRDENNNKFFFADVSTAGDSYSVNLSQAVAMDEGDTYTLSFEASTAMGSSRTIIAGIGLSVDPYTNVTETITLTSTNETYTFDFVANFQGSATTSRVLFDMGADTGIVVIDNVSLVKKDVPEDTLYYPLYEGTFGGTSREQTFLFQTGAESWAGFGNSNANFYPLDFPNGGQITFTAKATAATSIYFKFEANPHPNVEPSYTAPTQAITTESTVYTIPLTSQEAKTFNSALLYISDRDVTVNITDIKIKKFDTDGETVLKTSYPIYDAVFGNATYGHALTYPTGAEDWAGYANTNLDVSPVSLSNGGKITFKASATAATTLKFRFEANAHPNVDPAYDVTPKAITATEDTYEIILEPQGANTFNSQLLYIGDKGVTVNISDVVITATAGDPTTNATLSDLKVDDTTISGFDGAVTSYIYKVTEGTTTIPQITATTTISGAETTITQATTIPGDATVLVTATDGSTTETYTVSFNDVIPSTAADTPPARNAADVISLYSDAYTDVASNFDAGWCGSNSVSEIYVAGNKTMAYAGNACQGIVLDAGIDASAFTNYHVDIYIEAGTDLVGKVFNLKFVGTPTETIFKEVNHDINGLGLSAGEWISLDGTVDLTTMTGFKEFAVTSSLANSVYYDNLYVYKDPTASIEDLSRSLSIYPNPVENTLNVSAGDVVDSVTIFDLTGREVLRATPNAAAFSLDVSNLNKGLYLVTVKAGEQELNTKLVK
jgi:hypothetical protein